MQNRENLPEFIRELSMESTFRSAENRDVYVYGYATYDKSKLYGPQLEKTQIYNIQAHGRIPITKKEFLDMTLNTDKHNKILDFHMTYVRTFENGEDTLFGKRFKQPVRYLNVRTDIGPHKGSPHIDVEISDDNKNKVFDRVVKQDNDFTNYESAISAIFMQVERISNPLIGAQYWLSPTEIFPERVEKLELLRIQNKISTSLSILSRAINLKALEETRSGIIINEEQFWKIAESQVQLIREKEKELGSEVDIEGIHYSTNMSILPFPFFAPEFADYNFKAYRPDGSEVLIQGAIGVVWEKKNGINFIRELNYEESVASKNRS
jgi:hypothetical protein